MNISDLSFLPYTRHKVDDDDIAAVEAVLRGNLLTTGPTVDAFEAELGRRIGARFVVACSSGTAALHLATMALGIGAGDSVVVPAITFAATANVVLQSGANVVIADVDPDTGLLDGGTLRSALERAEGAKAVFPVHLSGQPADPKGIAEVAAAENLAIVEDACHALGTTYQQNREASAIGSCLDSDMAMFSFHPAKIIAMGEGGAISTNNQGLYEKLKQARNHGITHLPGDFKNTVAATDSLGNPNPWYYEVAFPGLNYRASDIHCALGLSQLKKLDGFIAKRRQLVAEFDRLLSPLSPVIKPVERVKDATPAWHLYPVLIDFPTVGLERADVIGRLHDQGIGSQVHFIPLHHHPCYQERYGKLVLPGAERYYARELSLPLYVDMTTEDVNRIVNTLADIIGG